MFVTTTDIIVEVVLDKEDEVVEEVDEELIDCLLVWSNFKWVMCPYSFDSIFPINWKLILFGLGEFALKTKMVASFVPMQILFILKKRYDIFDF